MTKEERSEINRRNGSKNQPGPLIKRNPELFASRFWSHCDKSGECWLWRGSVFKKGYGRVRSAGKIHSAHRVAWTLVNGEIPQGMHVCHKCDVPLCVNPAHLFLGTHQDNMDDRNSKGRCNPEIGTDRYNARLTPEAVIQIRASSEPARVWASRYGVSESAIRNAKSGFRWKHVGCNPFDHDKKRKAA